MSHLDRSWSVAAALEEFWEELHFRERIIVQLLYGLDGGDIYTTEEVARIFRTTKQRIRQIEARTVRKLHVLAYGKEP